MAKGKGKTFEPAVPEQIDWNAVLTHALTHPTELHRAFSLFHGYSLNNQALAMWQCFARGIEPGPIATFKRWAELGSPVRKGEKAMFLWMPIFVKRKEKQADGTMKESAVLVGFKTPHYWFAYSQTEGKPIEFESHESDWDFDRAVAALGFEQIPYAMPNGNILAYCYPEKKQFALNPVAEFQIHNALHEFGHIKLHGGDDEFVHDGKNLGRDDRELEAEAVALLVSHSLGLDYTDLAAGYIQHWKGGAGIQLEDQTVRRIFKAANDILKAGMPVKENAEKELVAA